MRHKKTIIRIWYEGRYEALTLDEKYYIDELIKQGELHANSTLILKEWKQLKLSDWQ